MKIRERRGRCGGVIRHTLTPLRPHALTLPRRGSVLLAVLVIVALLALGVYTFSEMMVFEAEATSMYQRDVEARLYAESGIEYAAAMIGQPDVYGVSALYNDSSTMRAVLVRDGEVPRARGRFSLVATAEGEDGQTVRYGLTDESGKINLSTLLEADLSESEQRARLSGLYGITDELADAILDWIDGDDNLRTYGAESEYYQSLEIPYSTANGPLDAIDDLLLVRDVTPELLYGEDANRNGRLDPNEDDGDASLPVDDADGLLNPGWASRLTLHSREANCQIDGTARINVNNTSLEELYDELETAFDTDVAEFICALRLYGPADASGEGDTDGGDGGGEQDGTNRGPTGAVGQIGDVGPGGGFSGGSGGAGGGGAVGGGPGGGMGGGRPGGGGGGQGPGGNQPGGGGPNGGDFGGDWGQGPGDFDNGMGDGPPQDGSGRDGDSGRGGDRGGDSGRGGRDGGSGRGSGGRGSGRGGSGGGGFSGGGSSGGGASSGESSGGFTGELDLTAEPQYEIETLWDLVGVEVKIKVESEEGGEGEGGEEGEEGEQQTEKTWISPWPNEPASVEEFFPELEELLTTSDEETIAGRINVNMAPPEVLMAIPGMTESLAQEIYERSPAVAGESANPLGAEGSVAWLVGEGLVTIDEMKEFSLYVTGRGSVYRVQSLGYFDAGGPVARLEAVIDGTASPPQILFVRELTPLGRGYGPAELQSVEAE